ncbi:taperin-like protein [Cricetulus griseus]|nr:taperin-like protein [Cricetulus griseus]
MAGLGRPGPGPRTAMPAWKREILERRRAKLAALSGGPGQGAAPEGQDEKLVLAESLGPLSENPFMRLESERRRGARPAQQLLELYRRVPGVRTIRADNILIIESAPGFPPAVPPAAGIRAAEVVVYETPQPGPPSPASATPSQRRWVSSATSANDSFEIRPAPKPDVESIPIGDLQARALANLRVNSRNSFMLIPKRKAPSEAEGRQSEEPNGEVGWASRSQGLRAQLVSTVDGAPAPEGSPLAAEMQWAAREGGCPRPATAVTDRSVRWQRPSSPPPFLSTTVEAEPAEGLGLSGLAKNGQEPGRSGLPVTFIDEVDSEEEASQETKLPSSAVGLPSQYHLDLARPRHTSELPNRGSNTFIVVPKRKPETLQVPHFSQANGQSQQQEAEEQDADSLSGPHTALENTLKKRYPTVHEIEVIGGYLALQKSCLIKAGSSRKKMKISFNDNSLYTTFEYPSESSLEQEEAEDEEEGEKDGEGEEVDSEKPFSVFLPRATFVSSVGPEIPRLPDGSSGLSSYTPKHSMAFSKWQEQTVVQAPSEVELPPKEVMLTPASQNDLSDFRSEPALYF